MCVPFTLPVPPMCRRAIAHMCYWEMAASRGRTDRRLGHDGQITKREIRAVTLSTLAPRRGELLWDIGAGSGSISIEWMLCHPTLRAIAIEHNAEVLTFDKDFARFSGLRYQILS